MAVGVLPSLLGVPKEEGPCLGEMSTGKLAGSRSQASVAPHLALPLDEVLLGWGATFPSFHRNPPTPPVAAAVVLPTGAEYPRSPPLRSWPAKGRPAVEQQAATLALLGEGLMVPLQLR